MIHDIGDEHPNSTASPSRVATRQLEAVFNHPASFAAILEPDGTLLVANEPAYEIIDALPADVEGQPFWETPWWTHSEAVQAELRDAIDRAATGESVYLETEYFGADNQRHAVDMLLQPVMDEGGEVDFIAAEGSDITERKRATTELRESQAALQQLYRITSSTDHSFEEKIRQLLDLGCERLDLDIGFLSTIDVDDGHFEIIEARGPHELIYSGATSPLSTTYCRRAIEADGLLGVQDAEAEGWEDDPAYERFDLGCYLGGKILVDGSLYGTLCFADDAARDIMFSEAERTFVELITEWVSHELERREAEQERREAQQQLEDTLERVEDGFFAVNDDWEFTYLNSRAEAILERSADDVVGANVWEEFPEAVNDLFYEEYHRAMETQESVSFEEYYDPLDVWVEVDVHPSEDGLSVFFREITERKRRETILRGLLETSRALLRAETPDDIAELVVEAVDEILGYDITEVHLYDPESETLEPAAATDTTRELMPEQLTYPVGEGLPGHVFEQNNAERYADITAIDDYDYGEIRSAMALPLGEHGTLSIGDPLADAFDESDTAVANILTTNAEAAFDRAERQQALVQYETILENVEDMVYVLDEEGRFTFVTQPLADRVGYDRADLVGEHVSLVLDDGAVAKGQDVIDDLRTSPSTSSRPFEVESITADGERVPIKIDVSLLPPEASVEGTLGVVRDISELAETRAQLTDERDRFTYLFENLPDPVIEVEFVDEEPLVRSVNPAFTDVFGYEVDRIHGESLNSLIVPSALDSEAASLDKRTLQGQLNYAEVRRETASGMRHFLFRGVPYAREGSDGERYGFGIYTDITEQKERERYLQVVNRILRHNLRNDLNVVSGYADLLADELDDPDLVDYAASIQEIADELGDMSEDARKIERLVGRRGADELDTIELTSRITDGIEECRVAHPDAKIATDLPDSVHVSADERLADILDHLVENAIEHNDHPTPRVELRVETCEPDADSADEVALTVLDNGPGIPERERALIMGERDITQLNHATGIGLWVVKWVVESYGGELTLAEADDGGSVVTLRLNRADAAT